MAEETKKRWRGLLEDFLISLVGDAGILLIIKSFFKKGAEAVNKTAEDQLLIDKRAAMLREFRKMEQNGINLDNLDRRYADSIRENRDPRFVRLLSKICPPEPVDPAKPVVSAGTHGAPQDDWQADIKWLNDMSDERFALKLEWLDHNVITKWWRIGWDWIVRVFTTTLAGLGIVGEWILGTLGFIWRVIVGTVRWASGSIFRIAIVVLVAAAIFWPLALITMVVLHWFYARGIAGHNGTQRAHRIGLFHFIGIIIGVILVVGIYFKLVPTFVDKDLSHAVLMAIAATFFFWSFRWVRVALLSFIAVSTLIFFLGGRTAAKVEAKTMWTGATTTKTTGTGDSTKPPAGKTAPASTPAIPPVHKSPRQNPQKDESLGEHDEAATTASSESTDKPPIEHLPISGNQGDIKIALTGSCRYVGTGSDILCRGYLEAKEPLDIPTRRLCDSVGEYQDNTGSGSGFNVWLSDNSIQFRGGGYMKELIPSQKIGFEFHFRAPVGVTNLGITLVTGDGKGNFSKSVFTEIPVSMN